MIFASAGTILAVLIIALVWVLIAISAREAREEDSLDAGAPDGIWHLAAATPPMRLKSLIWLVRKLKRTN